MKTIHISEALSDDAVEKLEGEPLAESSFDTLIESDADVFKPDGKVLLKFRTGVIPPAVCEAAFPTFREAAVKTDNRGSAAGRPDITRPDEFPKEWRGKVVQTSKTRLAILKQDGTLSNTSRAKRVNSGIVGFFDRNPRIPFCRLTAYNLNHPDRFALAMPFIRAADAAFAQLLPERHAAQMAVVQKSSQDFIISGTAFTTVTVNRNFRTAVHKDAGDLKAGFGVMSCIRRGQYSGCYLCFPKFKVAVNMGTGDVLCADVHEWHGNTPLIGKPGAFHRISLVFYYREGIKECGTSAEELNRAKRLRHA